MHDYEDESYKRHAPCRIDYNVRHLNQREKDQNCFYWTMIIALKLLPPDESYDEVEERVPECAITLMRHMRKQIVEWWYAHPDILYKRDRRWMSSLDKYFEQNSMHAVMQIIDETNNGSVEHVDKVITYLAEHTPPSNKKVCLQLTPASLQLTPASLQFTPPSNDERERMSHLIQTVLATSLPDDRRPEYEANRKKCSQILTHWRNDAKYFNLNSNLNRNHSDTVELKHALFCLVRSKMRRDFERLEYSDCDRIRFNKVLLDEIETTNVGALTEEYIAVAAIYTKAIVELNVNQDRRPPVMNLPKRKLSADEPTTYQLVEARWVTVYGTRTQQPDHVEQLTWSNARQLVLEGRGVVVLALTNHVDPVCPRNYPYYLTIERRTEIERMGYVVRNLRYLEWEEHRLAYALALTCTEMPRHFRQCCSQVSVEKMEKWIEHLKLRCIEWWCSLDRKEVVDMYRAFGLKFVRERKRDIQERPNDIDNNDHIDINDDDDHIDIDRATIESLTFADWETVLALSNVVNKYIFIFSDADNLTRYGGPLRRVDSSWTEVIQAIPSNNAVCCFASGGFDITHVVVRSRGSYDQMFRGERTTSRPSRNQPCVVDKLPDYDQSPQGSSSRSSTATTACKQTFPLSLRQADALVRSLMDKKKKKSRRSNKRKKSCRSTKSSSKKNTSRKKL